MALFLVTYDLMKSKDYPAVQKRLDDYTSMRVLFSTYLVDVDATARQVTEDLLKHIDADDRLMVVPVAEAGPVWSAGRLMQTDQQIQTFLSAV